MKNKNGQGDQMSGENTGTSTGTSFRPNKFGLQNKTSESFQ